LGALIGKAQRYVSDVKAEVNRSMELDELRKMKENVETAARDVEQSVQTAATDFEKDWSAANPDLTGLPLSEPLSTPVPEYRNPGKKWRLKQSSTPSWYKARHGMRTKALSGAARVARFRPRPLSSGKP
jgi:sec-independent protein translocase protein TatB